MVAKDIDVLSLIDRLAAVWETVKPKTFTELRKLPADYDPRVELYGVKDWAPYKREVKDLCQKLGVACVEFRIDSTTFDDVVAGADRNLGPAVRASQTLRTHVMAKRVSPDATPTLTKEAAATLNYLGDRHPVLCSLEDVEGGANISKATAKYACDELIKKNLTCRPEGKNKGIALTPLGLTVNKLITKSVQT